MWRGSRGFYSVSRPQSPPLLVEALQTIKSIGVSLRKADGQGNW